MIAWGFCFSFAKLPIENVITFTIGFNYYSISEKSSLVCVAVLVLSRVCYVPSISIISNPCCLLHKVDKRFSIASNSPITFFQFLHSLSPPGIPPQSGKRVPSLSPNPKILLVASLIPTVPYLTTSSSTELIMYCKILVSRISSWLGYSLILSLYKNTTDLGKNPAVPSMVPAQPSDSTGSNCCPRPVKVWKCFLSILGLAAICTWYETSPWESSQPTIFGCLLRASKVNGRTLTSLETPG